MYGLWALAQSRQISAAKSEATGARYKAREVALYAEYLERRIEKLNLITRAIWSFVQEATNLREEDLIERVKEIDLSDGQLDERVAKTAVQCSECNRTLSPRHDYCIWCGAERPGDSAFDRV
jgi:hypothetical protein